jgi:hypothetical protein
MCKSCPRFRVRFWENRSREEMLSKCDNRNKRFVVYVPPLTMFSIGEEIALTGTILYVIQACSNLCNILNVLSHEMYFAFEDMHGHIGQF